MIRRAMYFVIMNTGFMWLSPENLSEARFPNMRLCTEQGWLAHILGGRASNSRTYVNGLCETCAHILVCCIYVRWCVD